MSIVQAVSMLYLLILTAVMPPGTEDQYRLTLVRGTFTEQVNVDRTATGFDFSDGSGVVFARALSVSPLVYDATFEDSPTERVDLKRYIPTLAAPFAADQTTAVYPTTDGGTLTLTRKGKVIELRLSSEGDLAVTIEPRGGP
jgi:hypothetical protein